ncbi:MAG TPA: ethylbenzene dehydrogenase-related protein [Xanthobacteraceae bacterium]|nr:ethylbenzene dehydrogenase-related protein [Xanthobacteraceae bacterium]
MRQRKTDYGTIILHWLLVLGSGVAFATGLRIATEAPDRSWINLFDMLLPRSGVWTMHMQAAVVLVAVALAYTIYLARSGLSRRVQLDRIRLRGLVGRKQARLGAISVVLNWVFFLSMLALIISGGLLYFDIYAGHDAVMVHWYATWAMVGFAGLHILTHYAIGGVSQLLRIVRPERLPAPPPRLDAVELLTLLVEQSARLAPEAEHPADIASQVPTMPSQAPLRPHPQQPPASQEPRRPRPQQPPDDITDITRHRPAAHHSAAQQRPSMTARTARPVKPRNPTLQSNPLVVAAAIAITGTSALLAADWLSVDRLQIHRIDVSDAPTLDGDTSDRVWRNIQPYSVMTNEGGNFDGKGESRVDIRAVHDGTWAYFLFIWQDPTRSLKQLPLIKEIDGWHVLHNGHESGDERDYNEDKFSVLLTTSDAVLAGDNTFHAGPRPIPERPATMTGRGLHFTADNRYVDVWQWKATSGGPTGWMDDAHFGPPLDPTPEQVRYVTPYRGGFAPDPGTPNYSENFNAAPEIPSEGNAHVDPLVTPRRLPKDLAAIQAAMGGEISLDPNLGESDGARWFMTEAESVPYATELDKLIPQGTVLPGVILAGDFTGDRADVRCAARWASGHWALEVARKLDTKSPYDVPLKSGTFMRVAAFDHSQIRHTRHVRPIRLEVE